MLKDENEENKDEKKVAKKKEKTNSFLKVIIRRLPPGFTEEEFLKIFHPLPQNDFFRFVTGDRTLAPHNYCRAYINFINPEDILPFRDRFDGMTVENNRSSLACVVEYAPYPKTARKSRKKVDSKSNTIYQDPDYKKFIESLSKVEEKESLDVEQYLEDLEKEKSAEVVETPLTSYLKDRREEKRRIRDEKRRLDNERRKKKDEEKRKIREHSKKKRSELAKAKRSDGVNRGDYDGKKTLAETRPTSGKNCALNDQDDVKVKILQKDQKESSRFASKVKTVQASKFSQQKIVFDIHPESPKVKILSNPNREKSLEEKLSLKSQTPDHKLDEKMSRKLGKEPHAVKIRQKALSSCTQSSSKHPTVSPQFKFSSKQLKCVDKTLDKSRDKYRSGWSRDHSGRKWKNDEGGRSEDSDESHGFQKSGGHRKGGNKSFENKDYSHKYSEQRFRVLSSRKNTEI